MSCIADAAMFYSGGKKCILFFNPASTLSAVALYVNRAQIRKIEDLAQRAVADALGVLELRSDVRTRILDSLQAVQVCRTDDKSTWACMNQVILQLKYWLADGRVGYKPATAANMTYTLNAVGFVRYARPTDALAKVVAEMGWAQAPSESMNAYDFPNWRTENLSGGYCTFSPAAPVILRIAATSAVL